MTIDVRPASSRFHTELDWLDSWHSFSFGPFHDPQNTHHGLLLVNNDDVIAGGGGFGTHPHADMEIVTWVYAVNSSTATAKATRGSSTPASRSG